MFIGISEYVRVKGRARLWAFCVFAASPVVACFSTAEEPGEEPVASTSAALDPNQVSEPTWYKVTVSKIKVNLAQEPDQANLGIQKGEPTDNLRLWTPDNGYYDVAQLGVQVNTNTSAAPFKGGNPDITACTLGNAPAHTTFSGSYCTGSALGKTLDPSNQLTYKFSVNPLDDVRIALSLDNVESAAVSAMRSELNNSLATGLKSSADGLQLAGAALAPTGGVGAAVGILGSALSVLGDAFTVSDSSFSAYTEAQWAVSCVGGLMGPPSGVKFAGDPVGYCYYSQPAPDTLRIADPTIVDPTAGKPVDLTAERLQELTSTGPVTFEFNPSFQMTNQLGPQRNRYGFSGPTAGCSILQRGKLIDGYAVPGDDSQPQLMGGCASNVTIDITISRLSNLGGPAASAKSGDMAVLSNLATGQIDVVAEDQYLALSPPGEHLDRLVHYFGYFGNSGTHFNSELLSYGVNLATEPVIVSRDPDRGSLFLNLDAFWADSRGSLNTNTMVARPTQQIIAPQGTSGSVVPPNALVTATARTSKNLDVFFVGKDGNVYNVYWNPSKGVNAQGQLNWGVVPVTTQTCAMPHTSPCAGSGLPGNGVAVVARKPTTLDVFYVGRDGGVWTASYDSARGPNWTTSEAIYNPATDSVSALPSWGLDGSVAHHAHLTATARTALNMDVFWVGADGGLWNGSWQNDSWDTPVRRSMTGVGQPGGLVSAVGRQPNTLDVVFAGANGELEWSSFSPGVAWTTSAVTNQEGVVFGPASVGPGGLSLVAPSSYGLQAFYFNPAHQLKTVTWLDNNHCNYSAATANVCSSWSSERQIPWVGATTLRTPAPPHPPPRAQ
jgi:hypothetical protein